ncbi:hypothetical protein NVP1248O_17 [Vibrio phage 1.248.O._10N.261.54.F1]|nr:hypothetical protein NVP1248O_17 [Vibrio phage 1.248.O._10N.261.54.F1]
MITCKEDLVNTYIENDFGELRDLYINIALNYGVETCGGSNTDYLLNVHVIGVKDWGFGPQLEWIDREFKNARLITLSDLKPTPTKFVKVEESIFDLKGEFERGELYSSDCEGHYTQLKYKKSLYLAAHQDSIYRQVEIDWRDELDSYLDSISSLDSNFDEKVTLEFSKSKFAYNMSDNEFVAACHLVASLTENPKGV